METMEELPEADELQQAPMTMYVQVEQRPVSSQREFVIMPSTSASVGGGGGGNRSSSSSTSQRNVVTVKLECSDEVIVTQAWTLVASAGSIKERLSRLLHLPVGQLQLIHAGEPVNDDHITLEQLGGRVNETITLYVHSADPHLYPIKLPAAGVSSDQLEDEDLLMPLPDVITVHVPSRNGRPSKDLVVEIQNQTMRLPFLGGWRKKNSGIVFYHAQTQTDYTIGPDDDRVRILANPAGYQQQDRQVATVTNNQTQTLTSVSCQVRPLDWNMSRAAAAPPEKSTGIERPRDEDNTTTANRFVTTSVDQSENRDRSSSVGSSSEVSVFVDGGAQSANLLEPLDAMIIRLGDVTIERNSRCREDQDSQRLYFHEIELLNSTKSSAAKDQILRRLLHKVSQPKVWKASTGAVVEVDTAEIEQLREIRLMYEGICSATLAEDRVRALLLLKRTLWKESGPIVKELLQLAERELDLLSRGLMTTSLNGLQSRLRALLRHFIANNKLPKPQF